MLVKTENYVSHMFGSVISYRWLGFIFQFNDADNLHNFDSDQEEVILLHCLIDQLVLKLAIAQVYRVWNFGKLTI